MIPSRFLISVAAALLLAAGALAQPADGDTATAEPTEQASETGTDKNTGTTDTPAQPPGSAGTLPSDYRASEKISEDRPVSFPVDI